VLLEVARGRLFRAVDYRGFDAFVREELGMSSGKARALLRLERVAIMSADFREAWRSGQLTWTQAEALARVFVSEESLPWRRAWLDHASDITLRRLEDDVQLAIASGVFDPSQLDVSIEGDPSDGAEGSEALQTGARSRASAKAARFFFLAPVEVARLFVAVLATVQRRIERQEGRPSCQDEALAWMLDHVFEVWGRGRPVPKHHQIFERDGWRCTVPGCSSFRNLHDHHIRFRSAGGSNEPSNRTTLCAFHHLRGVHAGRVRCSGSAPDRLRFELGVREGQRSLAAYASYDVGQAV
jgi:hypothetical protein